MKKNNYTKEPQVITEEECLLKGEEKHLIPKNDLDAFADIIESYMMHLMEEEVASNTGKKSRGERMANIPDSSCKEENKQLIEQKVERAVVRNWFVEFRSRLQPDL